MTAVMLFAVVNLFSQSNTSSSSQISENQITLSESSIVLDSPVNNDVINYTGSTSNWFFVRMVLVLILVVVAIYFILRFVKNKNNPEVEDSDFMRKVASLNIAPGRTVEIVTLLDGKGYILGVTETNINLIAEIGNTQEEKELISAMNLTADKNQKNNKPANFSDVLEMFVGRGKNSRNNINNIYAETEQKVDDFVNSSSSKLDL